MIIVLFPALAVHVRAQLTVSGKSSATIALRYEVRPNITYLKTDTQELKLDLYIPYEPKKKAPTLVWFHGGGWTGSSKEEEALYFLPYLDAGWTVVNVEYRLARTALAPAAVEDCQCAMRWIAANAKSQKIDTETIVVSGISAGGHLALTTALLPRSKSLDSRCAPDTEPRIAAAINWFGPSDIVDLIGGPNAFDQAVEWVGDRPRRNEIAKDLSPIYSVRKGGPPIISIHGDKDKIIPYQQSVRLHAALNKEGVPNRLITIHGRGHGDFDERQTLEAYAAIRRFLVANKIL